MAELVAMVGAFLFCVISICMLVFVPIAVICLLRAIRV